MIVPDYITALIRTLKSDKTQTATPDDFLSRDGYAQWMETVRDQFQFVIAELLRGRYLLDSTSQKGNDVNKPKRARIDAKLRLKVLRANGLQSKDGKGRDAFCCIEFGCIPFPDPNPYKKVKDKDREMFLTESVAGTTKPEWNEHLTIQAKSITDKIVLSVWDKKKEYFLGMINVPVYDLVQASQREKGSIGRKYTLGPRPGRKDKYVGGEIFIEAMIIDAEPEELADSPANNVDPTEYLNQQLYSCHVNLRTMYKTLLRACLVLDVNTMGNEVTETTTELLGEESKALLKIFGHMWKIGEAFMVIANVEILFIMYKEFQLPTGALLTAYEVLYDNLKYNNNFLSRHERPLLVRLLDDMHGYYKQQVSNYKDHFPKNTPRRALETTILMLRMIHKNSIFREQHPDLPESFRQELRKIMTEASIARFQKLRQLSLPLSDDDAEAVIAGISQLAEMLAEEIELDVKYFARAFEKEVDISMLTADSFLKYFVIELENDSETFASDVAVDYAKSMFELYKKVKCMEKQFNKMLPSIRADLNVERWFAPFVMKWLDHLSETTTQWVHNAIAADQFEPVADGGVVHDGEPPLYSSSVTDLFTVVYSELEFLVDLGWSNSVQNAGFFQKFAQTVNRAIEQYCDAVGTGEVKDRDGGSSASGASVIANFTARDLLAPLISQSKQIGEVTVQECVKLSNMEYADTKLEQMYSDMNVTALTKTDRNHRQQMAPAATRSTRLASTRSTSSNNSLMSSDGVEINSQGRVSSTHEAEGQDVDFWFRRSKERLSKTRNDFIRALCSRIGPIAKDVISKALRAHEAAPVPANTNFSRLAQITGMAATQYSDKTVSGASIDAKIPTAEAEQAIAALTDYLNKNLETLAVNLSTKMAQNVIMATWSEVLNVIDCVIIPPLDGAIERDRRFLNKRQLSVAEVSLQVLKDFFHADGVGLGLPIRVLETRQYLQIQTLLQVYMNDSARIKREYELSLLKGQEKVYLLRLMRVRVECDGWEKKPDDKIWFETQLAKRKERNG
ncbi:hypothetical protein SeMB42_g07349 [Synchytrium endobioticum]|nr:hypothetical protein SeMB42_g07349 [Synchytrium endobioticum]